MLSRSIRLGAALLAGVSLAGAAIAEPAPVPAQSLRIATYNAYLLSPMFKCIGLQAILVVPVVDCLAQIAGQTESWAEHLADTILAEKENLDIIALNEIWDEDAKAILIRKLSADYPVQIRDIDRSLVTIRAAAIAEVLAGIPPEFATGANISIKGEDSGLMLFAKRDFRVLPLPNTQFKWGAGAEETLDASSPNVAFKMFEACGSDDCLSAKGAALIRLRHGPRGPIYNIVLTHMQADYPADGEIFTTERGKQFDDIRDLVETTLAPLASRRFSETVILLGDLNVPFLKTDTEWNARFGTASSFFRDPLYESFVFASSRADRTETNSVDHERFDYILASPQPITRDNATVRQRCVQHVTVPVRFRDLESDHNMVHADINRGFFHCTVPAAYRVKLPPSGMTIVNTDENGGTQDVTAIVTPGAMQWFFVKNDGTATWSIGTSNPQVKVDIYLPEDMTTPVSRYNKTPGAPTPGVNERFAVDQYVLPDKFFIRTSGINRTAVGNYGLMVKRHDCSTKANACLLLPGTIQGATLSPDTLPPGQINFQDEAWFRFDVVGNSDSGAAQTITLTASIHDEPRVDSKIDDLSDPMGGTLAESAMTNIRGYTGKIGGGGKGYVLIRQSSRATTPTPVKVAFDTNLKFITIKDLTCNDETNPELGSDDIFTRVDIDGTIKRAPSSGEVEFDCDDNRDPKDWLPRIGGARTKAYLSRFAMRLLEADTTSEDDDSMVKEVPDLPPGTNERMNGLLEWSFDDGKYEFNYDLRRRPNAPVADP